MHFTSSEQYTWSTGSRSRELYEVPPLQSFSTALRPRGPEEGREGHSTLHPLRRPSGVWVLDPPREHGDPVDTITPEEVGGPVVPGTLNSSRSPVSSDTTVVPPCSGGSQDGVFVIREGGTEVTGTVPPTARRTSLGRLGQRWTGVREGEPHLWRDEPPSFGPKRKRDSSRRRGGRLCLDPEQYTTTFEGPLRVR